MSKTHNTCLTAEQRAHLNRIAATAARHRLTSQPTWMPIRTANDLFASGLDGDDLEDAFAALSEREKTRFVGDPRRYLQAPAELSFFLMEK